MKTSRIGIVGVGPRGLTLLERLVASERARPSGPIEVMLFDPSPHGAGCHDPAQPDIHLVNTVAGQLTLFADASVADAGPVMAGPSFHQWLQQQAAIGADVLPAGERPSPDAYYPRGLFGRYLQWAFRYVCALAPPNVEIIVRRGEVLRADRDDDAWVLDAGDARIRVDYLFLTTGHTPPRRAEQRLRGATLEIDDPYPMRSTLAAIGPDMTVAVEGMGLTSFDVLAELTVGRGGRFVADAAGVLRYECSGREPRLLVHSRSGVPLGARALNQKGVANQYRARFLTLARVRALRAERRLDFVADILPLLLADMELAWCEAWLRRSAGVALATAVCARLAHGDEPERRALIEQFIPADERFSWERLASPVPQDALASRGTFGRWLCDHLRRDVREARRGNLGSPLKAACDVLRDLRDNLRAAIEFGGLTEASHRWVMAEFMPVMNRLAVGPPASRLHEMLALMDAGVLQADFGPGATCRASADGGKLQLANPRWADEPVPVDVLVRARISMHSPADDASPLLRGLLDDGHVRLFRNGDFHPGGIEIDRGHHWVNRAGQAVRNAWALGIPTEGAKWCTFVVPRPGVNSTAIVDAGRVVGALLEMVRAGAAGEAVHAPQPLRTEAEASQYASLYGSL